MPNITRIIPRQIDAPRNPANGQQRLVLNNLALIKEVARCYNIPDAYREDILQEGVFGLLRAAELFDEKKGAVFKTYASYWIKHFILRALRKYPRAIHIPNDILQQESNIRRWESLFTHKHMRPPTQEETEAEFGKSSLTDTSRFKNLLSLDIQAVSKTPRQDEQLIALDQLTRMRTSLETLPKRLALVLKMRFGLIDGKEKSLAEVAALMDPPVSRQRVEQIQKKAIALLRKKIEAEGISAGDN